VYALVFNGLENKDLGSHPVVNRVSKMERVARSTFVRLEAPEDGEKLALVMQ
jgi:hypothetical protein